MALSKEQRGMLLLMVEQTCLQSDPAESAASCLQRQIQTCNVALHHNNMQLKRLQANAKRNATMLLHLVANWNGGCRVWVREKNGQWWDTIAKMMDNEEWKANFRISKLCFTNICQQLEGKLSRQDTHYRKVIPLEKRVAMCIYVLSSSAELRTVANLFGVGKSTLCQTFHEFCKAVVDDFMPELIALPTTPAAINQLTDGFMQNWQFPQAFGALDGCHIAVSPPKKDATDYYCYKQFYSTVLLAMCDATYKFTYVNVGSPGKKKDAYVFNESSLARFINQSALLQQSAKEIAGLHMEPVILGDSAFPLLRNLLKPYPDVHLSSAMRQFNFQLSHARRVIENAFGRLKGRFPILRKSLEFDLPAVPAIVLTCCTLHNMCELLGDSCYPYWITDVVEAEDRTCIIGHKNIAAREIRDHLAMNFFKPRDQAE